MASSPFLYYNPGTAKQQSAQRGQFVSHPPGGGLATPVEEKPSSGFFPSMPFSAGLVYSSSRPSSSHQPTTTIHAPTPVATVGLSTDSLQKATGLLTPSSPTLIGLDGPNGSDVYFFPPTPSLDNSESGSPMSSQLPTPIGAPWALEECHGNVGPSELELPSTPQFWKERTPISPGTVTV